MAIDLSNYVEVSERIETFRTKHPEGSYQTELVELPAPFADKFVAVKATVYRSAEDQTPGVDMAWEPVPGKTPYTKDSELQNACTSAIGRAIIAAGAADARRGIVSREEVEARQPVRRQNPRKGPPTAATATGPMSLEEYAREATNQFQSWTPAERADSYKRHCKAVLDGKPANLDEVGKVVEAMVAEYYGRFPVQAPF